MTESYGYLSVDKCMTVRELRSVLAACNDDDQVEIVTDLGTGEASALRAAMASDESVPTTCLLYLDHPGEG